MNKFYQTRSIPFYITIGILAFLSEILLFTFGYVSLLSTGGEILAKLLPATLAVVTFIYLVRKLYATDLFFEKPLASSFAIICLLFAFVNGIILLITS